MGQLFRKFLKLISQKAGITLLSFFIQIAIIVLTVMFALKYIWWVYLILQSIGIIMCLYIVSRDMNPSYKLSWCILILLIPAVGGLLYIFIGRQHTPRRVLKRLKKAADTTQVLLNMTNTEILSKRQTLNPTGKTCADLVINSASYPVYGDTKTKYYPLGDDFFPDLVKDIKNAEKFVFMEYFIIDGGKIWDEIEAALIDRAKNGVEVKIIYDDVGSMFTLPKRSIKRLIAGGVQIKPFNKITLSFDMRLNNRSHRKITVIDGNIAYTGGNNLADEYANKKVRFGHWKDTHMRFEGGATWSFTAMFLAFWHILSKDEIKYTRYLPTETVEANGYVQPLSSGPGRNDNLIESAFINMISTAKRYVYITTPYLILDNEIQTVLINAARSGVDVRIIIPKIPDKRTVYLTTKSFVPPLVKAGVKVYTYTPGFIHAKMMIVDDECAFIGTCNMDYRSFYLHYECGALLYNVDTIPEMKADFIDTQEESREVLASYTASFNPLTRLGHAILRLLAPLM